MKKGDKLFAVLVVFLFVVSRVNAQSADNYIPEVKLLASSDGRYFDEDIKTIIKTGQSYFLRVEASVRVPGKRLQWFGANEILCTIAFPEDQIIDINVTDSDTSWNSFSLQQNIEGQKIEGREKRGILEIVFYYAVFGGNIATVKLVADKIREQRQNVKLNDFLKGNHSNTFSCYSFSIPTSPVNDNDLARGVRPRTVSITFKIDPLQTGSQAIKIFYEKRVSDLYMKYYTLVVN